MIMRALKYFNIGGNTMCDNIVILNDEFSNEVEFEFLDLVEYESEEYVVLLPVEDADEEDPGEVVILRIESTSDFESYTSVEDEDVLQKVFQIFKDRFKNGFSFLDED